MIDRTVPVVSDPKLHPRAPEGAVEEMMWAYLDTAYNLLRELAVRYTCLLYTSDAADE